MAKIRFSKFKKNGGMGRKTKLIISIVTLCMSMALVGIGVFAIVTPLNKPTTPGDGIFFPDQMYNARVGYKIVIDTDEIAIANDSIWSSITGDPSKFTVVTSGSVTTISGNLREAFIIPTVTFKQKAATFKITFTLNPDTDFDSPTYFRLAVTETGDPGLAFNVTSGASISSATPPSNTFYWETPVAPTATDHDVVLEIGLKSSVKANQTKKYGYSIQLFASDNTSFSD